MNTILAVHGMGGIGGWGRGFAACNAVGGGDGDGALSALRIGRVAPDTLNDRVALKRLRRADRFSKMAALAAWDAVHAAGLAAPDTDVPSGSSDVDLGIIVTTAFGPHRTTFAFLDDILDYGDAAVSPTTFSHSVHNAAAAYIGIMLDRRGPTCTVTDFKNPFYCGMQTASLWLTEGRCTHVLVGYVEEASEPMVAIAAARRAVMPTVGLQPFQLSFDPRDDISEGSVFLVLSLPGTGGVPLNTARFTGDAGIADLATLLV